jgi:hypothetical protein
MAGDLNLPEYAIILPSGPAAIALAAPAGTATPFLHRYGSRVLLGRGAAVPSAGARVATTAADLPDASLANLS